MLIAIPVKPFGVAKARLSPVLNAAARSRLGRAVAAHTVGAALLSGERVVVVTGDDGVAAWARELGAGVVREAVGGGLDGAARAAVASAGEGDWLILHADLPGVSPPDIAAALHLRHSADYVIAPSYDGGTSLIAGRGPFAFAYGPGSFHRHLRSAQGRARALIRTGLALDLDTPRDLALAGALFAEAGFPGVPA